MDKRKLGTSNLTKTLLNLPNISIWLRRFPKSEQNIIINLLWNNRREFEQR